MFGYVSANYQELTENQKNRYGSVYCGICLRIRQQSGNLSRIGLSYDMAFLALLHMSLYEPDEHSGKNTCLMHPIKRRDWVDCDAVRYAADMNVALAYYKFLDDWHDDGKHTAHAMAKALEAPALAIADRYPRQCSAIRACIEELSRLEKENCPNPDLPAASFGKLMAEILVFRQDHWENCLRQMGDALGRFIYLMDAAMDYHRDRKHNKYNPFLAMGQADPGRWEEYLVHTMGRCTDAFERLPLVQDKDILDNILYSGVWVQYRGRGKERKEAP